MEKPNAVRAVAKGMPWRRQSELEAYKKEAGELQRELQLALGRISTLTIEIAENAAELAKTQAQLALTRDNLNDAEIAIHSRDGALNAFRTRYFEAYEALEAVHKASVLRFHAMPGKPLPVPARYEFTTGKISGGGPFVGMVEAATPRRLDARQMADIYGGSPASYKNAGILYRDTDTAD